VDAPRREITGKAGVCVEALYHRLDIKNEVRGVDHIRVA
jgi:hypothetical protein